MTSLYCLMLASASGTVLRPYYINGKTLGYTALWCLAGYVLSCLHMQRRGGNNQLIFAHTD